MTHLSRSDNDKMFSDQAENGSADDDFRNDYDDEDYDMSGSGDHRKCILLRAFEVNFDFSISFHRTTRSTNRSGTLNTSKCSKATRSKWRKLFKNLVNLPYCTNIHVRCDFVQILNRENFF